MKNERSRAKELEEKEKTMDADGLKTALKRERAHSARLAADLAGLWSSAVQSQADAEVLEEGRINSLMRRMDRLQREKGRIIVELEREEEMVRGVDFRLLSFCGFSFLYCWLQAHSTTSLQIAQCFFLYIAV